jgi:hypothetical protein
MNFLFLEDLEYFLWRLRVRSFKDRSSWQDQPAGGTSQREGLLPAESLMCDGKPPELRLFVPSTRSLPYIDITGLDNIQSLACEMQEDLFYDQ